MSSLSDTSSQPLGFEPSSPDLIRNPAKEKMIAQSRQEKGANFDLKYAQLTSEQRKRFDDLMKEVYCQQNIDPVSHSHMATELKWRKIDIFFQNPSIRTLKDENVLTQLYHFIRSRVASNTN